MTTITQVMEVSTGHLPAEVARAIDDGIFAWRPAMSRPEGWLFYVPDEGEIPGEGITSKAFDLIISRARSAGCAWVLFDRDEPLSDFLPTYDW